MAILAQRFPVFKPSMRVVTNITNGFPAVVTTSFDHGYGDGLIIRIVMPLGYGMQEINGLFGSIVVTGATTYEISIDTTYFSAFSSPVTSPENYQYCQCIPIGEVNSTLYQATENQLPF